MNITEADLVLTPLRPALCLECLSVAMGIRLPAAQGRRTLPPVSFPSLVPSSLVSLHPRQELTSQLRGHLQTQTSFLESNGSMSSLSALGERETPLPAWLSLAFQVTLVRIPVSIPPNPFSILIRQPLPENGQQRGHPSLLEVPGMSPLH